MYAPALPSFTAFIRSFVALRYDAMRCDANMRIAELIHVSNEFHLGFLGACMRARFVICV